jgi:nucleoside-diphosphate-sugar epimerase
LWTKQEASADGLLDHPRRPHLRGRPCRAELDLEDGPAVQSWFAEHKPTVVVLAAAKVGGIQANNSYPADFLLDNLKIQTNVIETAWRSGVRRLLFLGSSCIYPKFAEQPIREEALLTGALEPTNEWYAIAKITGNTALMPSACRRSLLRSSCPPICTGPATTTTSPTVTCCRP